jgi:hypothetical protein
MALDLEVALATLRATHKPHMLCKDLRGDVWEFISYAYVEGDRIAIKIRVPGDPTSMITADALMLDPEGQSCMCSEAGHDFYLRPEYYRERQERLSDCPALFQPLRTAPNTITQILGFGRLWNVTLGCGCTRRGLTSADLKREQIYVGKRIECDEHPTEGK